MNYKGQAGQDIFVSNILKNKTRGSFLEIGSGHPIQINNTYVLEKNYDWRGIMIERLDEWLDIYKIHRPNSIHIIDNATEINYKKLLEENNMPLDIDYLQIDLGADDGSTLETLKKLNDEIMGKYKFATVTFEHDIYHTNFGNTRKESRKIFGEGGYVKVFEDIATNRNVPFEDWYVHPDLVDMEHVNNLKEKNEKNYSTDVKVNKHFDESKVDKCMNYRNIEY